MSKIKDLKYMCVFFQFKSNIYTCDVCFILIILIKIRNTRVSFSLNLLLI